MNGVNEVHTFDAAAVVVAFVVVLNYEIFCAVNCLATFCGLVVASRFVKIFCVSVNVDTMLYDLRTL